MKKLALLPIAALAFTAACEDTPTSADLSPAEAPVLNTTNTNNNGPVWVDAQFTFNLVTTGSGATGKAAGVNGHPQAGLPAGGTCRDASGQVAPAGGGAAFTFWYNQKGQVRTSAKFCEEVAGSTGESTTIVVTCDLAPFPATYAAGSGNEALNVDASAFYEVSEDLPVLPNLFVHYRARQNDTRGTGTVDAKYTCDRRTDGSVATVSAPGIGGTATLKLNAFSQTGGTLFVDNKEGAALVGRGLILPAGANANTALTVTLPSNGTGLALTDLSWVFRSRVGA